jgi:pectate lyase
VINNVMYNWGGRIGSTTRGAVVDWINNYAQAGPMSSLAHVFLHQAFTPFHPQEVYPEPSLYLSGNVVHPRHPDPSADNWALYRVHYAYTPLPASYRRVTPWLPAPVPVTVQSAVDAYESVLADVGANARLDCAGTWVPNADTVDVRLLADVRDQTGPAAPIRHPVQVGGYPVLAPGTPCADRDQDGMPDAWEQLRGFDLTDPADGLADADGDGYTNVEEYLHGKSGSS